ncbi:hypothetical protein RFI_20885 [Reticulomyxa filosa]|uniref:Uncharacterized protein n=1 Tax=Reticulomyxa filosa TaxID=46433 RepID=X6MRN0_RETFI|nr:hypothetical protein RFI_20885 [Reticulomyxa filosa]|eukprot:ETO16454.1 hypothetical protein RFI_20885 [Reticulomyxa filosa]
MYTYCTIQKKKKKKKKVTGGRAFPNGLHVLDLESYEWLYRNDKLLPSPKASLLWIDHGLVPINIPAYNSYFVDHVIKQGSLVQQLLRETNVDNGIFQLIAEFVYYLCLDQKYLYLLFVQNYSYILTFDDQKFVQFLDMNDPLKQSNLVQFDGDMPDPRSPSRSQSSNNSDIETDYGKADKKDNEKDVTLNIKTEKRDPRSEQVSPRSVKEDAREEREVVKEEEIFHFEPSSFGTVPSIFPFRNFPIFFCVEYCSVVIIGLEDTIHTLNVSTNTWHYCPSVKFENDNPKVLAIYRAIYCPFDQCIHILQNQKHYKISINYIMANLAVKSPPTK